MDIILQSNIVGDIIDVDLRKLKKLRGKIAKLRGKPNNVLSRELESIAASLGREKADRGKEPTWVSRLMPGRNPVSIPNHPGALKRFTAGNILDQLEEDIDLLEEHLEGGQ